MFKEPVQRHEDVPLSELPEGVTLDGANALLKMLQEPLSKLPLPNGGRLRLHSIIREDGSQKYLSTLIFYEALETEAV